MKKKVTILGEERIIHVTPRWLTGSDGVGISVKRVKHEKLKIAIGTIVLGIFLYAFAVLCLSM